MTNKQIDDKARQAIISQIKDLVEPTGDRPMSFLKPSTSGTQVNISSEPPPMTNLNQQNQPDWQLQAYAELGRCRDWMEKAEIDCVQKFLGPLVPNYERAAQHYSDQETIAMLLETLEQCHSFFAVAIHAMDQNMKISACNEGKKIIAKAIAKAEGTKP